MSSQTKDVKPVLKLDWCSHAAAKWAVEHWHYSKSLPGCDSVKIGVWENDVFVGCILFSRGNNNNMGKPFGLKLTEICELTRVALRDHQTPVSRIVSIALRMLRTLCPGIRLIVSYADPERGHHGGIYQALGWAYTGNSRPQRELAVAGKWMHKRSATSKWGTAAPERIKTLTGLEVSYGPIQWKHAYYLPLDTEMRACVEPLRKPYPKRQASTCAESITADAPAVLVGEGGAAPTSALEVIERGET